MRPCFQSSAVFGDPVTGRTEPAMNYLSREKQIEIIAALCEGVGQRAITRLTGTDPKTVKLMAIIGASVLIDPLHVWAV